MMNDKHLPKSYWAKAANKVVYLMNMCTTFGVHDITVGISVPPDGMSGAGVEDPVRTG